MSLAPDYIGLGDATTEEWWEVDGVILNTLAYNISTIEGRESIPPRRGENRLRPNRAGRYWVEKQPDQKVITLSMWVRGSETDGTIPDDQVAVFRTHWEVLKGVFGAYDRELVLTRRIRTRHGVQVRRTYAEVGNDMPLQPRGPSAGLFMVDLVMADPFWYGEERVERIDVPPGRLGVVPPIVPPVEFTVPSQQQYLFADLAVYNDGTADAWPTIRWNGPLTNPRVEHLELGTYWETTIALTSDQFLVLDADAGILMLDGIASRYGLRVPGSQLPRMVRLATNTFRFRADVGEGNMEIRWSPPYL